MFEVVEEGEEEDGDIEAKAKIVDDNRQCEFHFMKYVWVRE